MKKFIALFLCLCMAMTFAPAAFAVTYSDTDAHWAEGSIDRWASYGIIEDSFDGKFNPDGSMTRAQAAAVFVRLLKLSAQADLSNYADVDPDAWYAEYIAKCVAAGIMNGVGAEAMDPNGTVTREQMMTMLCRAVGIKPEATSIKEFADANKVSDWAEGYVNALTNAGIVSGMGDNTVAPAEDMSRASIMALLDKGIASYATTAGETVEAAEGATGIVLVAAPDVTVTGAASCVAITEGAAGGTTTLTDATVGSVTVSAEGSEVVLGKNTTAESVDVAESAAGSSVKVESTAQAGSICSAAPESTLKVEGTVDNVTVTDTASNTNVETGNKATVGKVDTSADGTTVSGTGKVENVATSGNNTTVQTGGTKVEAAEGTTGTTAGGTAIEGGSSATTAPAAPAHSHKYTDSYVSDENGEHTSACSCGKTKTETCSYVDGACEFCGYREGAEAKIGTAYYTSFVDAVAAGGDIVLLKNVTVESSVEIEEGNTVVLDLNGNKIIGDWNGESTTNHIYAINNYGTFTVNDSSNPSTGAIVSRGIYNYGTMTLNSGTIDACDGNGGIAINGQSGSSFTMNGGSVVTSYEDGDAPEEGYDATTIKVPTGGTATINGGTITNISNFTVAIQNGGATTVNGGTFTSIHSTIYTTGTMTINGGTFTCNGLEGITAHALVAEDGSTTTINGGTFNGKDNYNGFNVDACAGSTVTITGGIFQSVHSGSLYGEGTITVSGGTFFDKPASSRIASGYKATESNGNWIVVERVPGEVLTAAEAQEALDNATSGTVIRLASGVNYGTLVFRQNASSKVVDITDAGGDAPGNEKYRKIENLTIVGAEGATIDGFDFKVSWIDGSGASYIEVTNLTVEGVTFSGNKTPFNFDGSKGSSLGIDGLNIIDCKMKDTNGTHRFVFQQITGYKELTDKTTSEYVMTAGIKNLSITGCEVENAYMVIESRAMENLTITDNIFKNIKARDMLITSDTTNYPQITYTGTVTITGNKSDGGEERFVRASGIGNATLIITGNTITNYKGGDLDYIKVSGATGATTIENNNITDGTDGNRNFTVTIG